jgi:hypothetical protein
MEDLTSFLPDYVRDFVSQEDLVKILDQQKAQDASLEKLKTQLLAGWQGLGENVGIGSAGTDKAEIGGRPLGAVAEDFARRLQQQGITDLSQAKFAPGAQASWTAEGKGNVSLVATQDGRLVPVWGSSSDAGKARNIALTLASAWVAPGLAGALGGGLGGAAGAGALLGGTRAAVTGGDILKGALMGGVTGGVGQLASPYLADLGKAASQAVGGDTLGKIASGAVQGAGRSAIGAAMTGDSIVDALLSGAVGGATSAGTDILVKGTNSTLNEYLKDVPAPIRNAVTSAATAGLLGKDIEKAAINSLVGSLMKELPSSTGGRKLADVTGADATEGFFAPGGEGYYEGTIIPDWDILPEARELTSGTSMDPMELNRFLEANVDGPVGREVLLQDYFPEIYGSSGADTSTTSTFTPGSDDVYEDIESLLARYENQGFANQPTGDLNESVNVTGTLPKTDVIIPDWDFMEVPDRTPGSPTDTTPGTVLLDDDRTVATTPGTTGTKTTTPTKSASPKSNLDSLMKALLLMQQRPQEQKEQYQLANMPDYEDLMYGLSSGEMPYMRG